MIWGQFPMRATCATNQYLGSSFHCGSIRRQDTVAGSPVHHGREGVFSTNEMGGVSGPKTAYPTQLCQFVVLIRVHSRQHAGSIHRQTGGHHNTHRHACMHTGEGVLINDKYCHGGARHASDPWKAAFSS